MESRISNLEQLEDEATEATINLMRAQDNNAGREKIAKLLNVCNFYEEMIKQYKSSTNVIQEKLNQPQVQNNSSIIHNTDAVYTFTDQEFETIKTHYEKMPMELQALFNAALEDDINFETIKTPVFLKGDGFVYEEDFLQAMLKKGDGESNYPRDQRKFTKKDIIPCNTLTIAMQYLLLIIQGNAHISKPITLNYENPSNEEKLIEQYYLHGMENKHRILFDKICRDTETKLIMRKPVFLPDGYAYDEQTALNLLDIYGEVAVCPGSDIQFTKEDITPCRLAINVLDQLKLNIQAQQQKMQSNNNNSNSNNNSSVSYSSMRK